MDSEQENNDLFIATLHRARLMEEEMGTILIDLCGIELSKDDLTEEIYDVCVNALNTLKEETAMHNDIVDSFIKRETGGSCE